VDAVVAILGWAGCGSAAVARWADFVRARLNCPPVLLAILHAVWKAVVNFLAVIPAALINVSRRYFGTITCLFAGLFFMAL
jgi:hypothetical protein